MATRSEAKERRMEKLVEEVWEMSVSRYTCPEELYCFSALAKLGQDAAFAVPELIFCLKHRQYPVRREAALALGSIGPKAQDAIPHLVTLKQDRSQVVRTAAEKALSLIAA